MCIDTFGEWAFILEIEMEELAKAIVVGALFTLLGWVSAHSEVSTECKRLGSFYFGNTTFKCEVAK